MEIKVGKKDIIWSYIAQFFNIGAGIIILPAILKKLSSEELGIWYIFLAISSLVYLLDFGFLPTIQRNISYIFSGAEELLETGISNRVSKTINYKLLYDLIETSKKLYRNISLISLIILLTLGTFYIYTLVKDLNNTNQIIIAWILYILSILVNFYYYYFNALIRGKGLIAEANKIMIFSRLGFIIFSFIALNLGLGLISLTLGNIISVIIIRILSYKVFFTKTLKENLKKQNKKIDKNLIKIIWHNASKLGLVSLGAFLILKGNTFIASKYLSLKEVAEYGLSLQLFSVLTGISSSIISVFISKISQYRVENNLKKLQEYYSLCVVINSIFFISGTISIIFIAPKFLYLLGSNTTLLSQKYLIFMGIYLFLEVTHSNASGFIVTSNNIPFVNAAIFSGIAIIVLSLILIKITNLGLWSLLISQCIVQLSYNNWKWPLEVNRELNINFLDILKIGMKKIIGIIRGEKI